MKDNHLHIINHELLPVEVAFGRWRLSPAAVRTIEAVGDALIRGDLPGTWDDVVRAIVGLLAGCDIAPQRLHGFAQLVRLFYLSVDQYIAEMCAMLQKNGISGGSVLLVDATPRQVMRISSELAKSALDLRLFVPPAVAHVPGIAGIKYYPGYHKETHIEVASLAEKRNLPIVAHCSPGGIFRGGAAAARRAKLPGKWLEALRDRSIRLCLAHAGGDAWTANMLRSTEHQGAAHRTLEYMMTEAHPPTDWRGRLWIDTAFHGNQDSPRYAAAAKKTTAPWRILWGSDWPLHLPAWSYSQAVEWGRTYWGDSEAEYRLFVEGDCHD